jgi:DNA-3-methyladenine glycosylase
MGLSYIPENAEETGFSLSQSCTSPQATPIATTTFQPTTDLSPEFFCRPAQEVAPELIGCLLLKRQTGGELLGGVIVETEAYCRSEPACHGHRRRSPSNETLFGEPGHWYVYVSYGIHHCVKRVTLRMGQLIEYP